MSEIENNIVAETKPPVEINPSDSVAEHNDALGNVVAAAGDVNANATSASETHAAEPEPIANEISPKIVEKKTPVKRTPSKRLSAVERAQKESEEIVRNMGGSIELEGGRRTRSSSRGTPSHAVITPPPAKKPRVSSGSAKTTPTKSTPKGGRAARGRVIEIADVAQTEETTEEDTVITDAPVPVEPVKPAEKVEVDATVEAKEIAEKETPAIEIATNVDEVKPSSALEKQNEIVEEEKSIERAANNEINATLSDVVDSAEELSAEADTPEIIEEKPIESKAVDSMEVDEVKDDAVEPAVEATEVATASTVAIAEEVKNNSMPINEVAATEQLIKLTPPKIVIEDSKSDEEFIQSTPEPMEVDSNSKSNDSVVVIETPIDDISVSIETPPVHVNNTTTAVITATVAEITKSDVLEVPKPPPANNGIETAAVLENNITAIADGVVKTAVEIDVATELNVQNKQDAGESNCGEPKITNYTAVSAASE